MLTILEHANVLVDFNETSYDEWQVNRQKQLEFGGSEAGTIIGENSYKSPYRLYLEKIGQMEPDPVGQAAETGHILEPVIADTWFQKVGKPGGMTIEEFKYLLQAKDAPFMFGNIDRLIRKGDDFGLLECKNVSEYLLDEWNPGEILANGQGKGKVPKKYYAQFQHYLKVTGLEWGWFAALVGGNKWIFVYVERNDSYIDWLVEQELMFWQRIELRMPPEPDGSDCTRDTLLKQFPKPSDEYSEVKDDSFGELILKRDLLKQEIKDREKELAEAENLIKAAIGENKGVKWHGYTVSWGWRNGRKAVDAKLLEEKYPDVFEEVLKEGEGYRQLSVAKPKKQKGKVS
jgi:putative phage-type endonuclease